MPPRFTFSPQLHLQAVSPPIHIVSSYPTFTAPPVLPVWLSRGEHSLTLVQGRKTRVGIRIEVKQEGRCLFREVAVRHHLVVQEQLTFVPVLNQHCRGNRRTPKTRRTEKLVVALPCGAVLAMARIIVQAFCLLLVAVGQGLAEFVVSFPCSVFPGIPFSLGISVLRSSQQPTVFTAGFLSQTVSQTDPTSGSQQNQAALLLLRALGKRRMVANYGKHVTMEMQLPVELANLSAVTLVVSGQGVTTFTQTKELRVGQSRSVFVQTDKAVYKPAQDIRLRVLAVQPNLLPYEGVVDVLVKDSEKTTVAQWLGVQLENGIWSETLPLSSQPPLGVWTIWCNGRGSEPLAYAQIEIKEYAALPKFDVSLDLPPYIALSDSSAIVITVKAKYTYGQPVKGTVNLQLGERMQFYSDVGPCYGGLQYAGRYYEQQPLMYRHLQSNLLQLDGNGKVVMSMTRKQFLNILCPNFIDYKNLIVNASVMDDVTGEVRWSEAKTQLYTSSVKVSFDKDVTKTHFKPGLTYPVRILVSTQDGLPGPDGTKVMFTVEKEDGRNTTRQALVLTSRNGVIERKIQVTADTMHMAVHVHLPKVNSPNFVYGRADHITPIRVYSPSDTFMQLYSDKMEYNSGTEAKFNIQATSAMSSLVCAVISRGRLLRYFNVPLDAQSPDQASFVVQVKPAMAPLMRVLCFFSQQGEFVVDKLEVAVTNPFSNKVTVAFDVEEAEPGHNATVTLRAAAESTVAISVVDQSALLMGEGNDITPGIIRDELSSYDSFNPGRFPPPVAMPAARPIAVQSISRGLVSFGSFATAAQQILESAGMCVLTGLQVPSPPRPKIPKLRTKTRQAAGGSPMAAMMPAMPSQAPAAFANDAPAKEGAQFGMQQPPETVARPGLAASLAQPEHVRTFFPETWLWETGKAGSDGRAVFKSQIPDSITSWVASGFAMSRVHGLGVSSEKATVRAFRPFFVTLNLPYSVIRGEELHLQVNIFNYISESDAIVELKPSEDFVIHGSAHGQAARRNTSLPSNGAGRVQFVITAQKAGHITLDVTARSRHAADQVKRQLLVEPEGVPLSYSRALLISLPCDETTFSENLNLDLPSDVVPGSVRTEVSVIGDLMGPALSNLDQLLKMPTGCGEQNMLGFAPDVFIMKYLTNTKQLTPEIAEKAKRYMTTGYQRQLTYRHEDHSFSAFGKSDGSGSLWLTAFVVKSFAQATPFIQIDKKDLSKSMRYILSKQKADGSFPLVGTVIHKSMKGGVGGSVSRTAYVLTALAEAQNVSLEDLPGTDLDRGVLRCRQYLERNLKNAALDNYTLALTAYALAMSGSPRASQALQLLVERSDQSANAMYWTDSRSTSQPSGSFTSGYHRASSSSIELTAYGLLSLQRVGRTLDALKVARWLSLQRNSFGGFGSTQDTVVGLQALAELASDISGPSRRAKQDLSITVKPEQSKSHTFSVTPSNSNVLQKVHNVVAPTQLSVQAKGCGVAVFSAEVFYNTKERSQSSYSMSTDCSLQSYLAGLSATCQYCTQLATEAAERTPGGMALFEIGLPSGFEVNMEQVLAAAAETPVKRVESPNGGQVVLYLDEVLQGPICINMTLHQVTHVTNLQASMLRTLNYYQPSVESSLLYEAVTPEKCRQAFVSNCPALPAGADGRTSRSSASNVIISSALIMVGLFASLGSWY